MLERLDEPAIEPATRLALAALDDLRKRLSHLVPVTLNNRD